MLVFSYSTCILVNFRFNLFYYIFVYFSVGPPSQRSFKEGNDDEFLPKATALFDFEAEGDNEISLKVS